MQGWCWGTSVSGVAVPSLKWSPYSRPTCWMVSERMWSILCRLGCRDLEVSKGQGHGLCPGCPISTSEPSSSPAQALEGCPRAPPGHPSVYPQGPWGCFEGPVRAPSAFCAQLVPSGAVWGLGWVLSAMTAFPAAHNGFSYWLPPSLNPTSRLQTP